MREFQQVLRTLEQVGVEGRRVAGENQTVRLNRVAQVVDLTVVEDSILGDPKPRDELRHDGVLRREVKQEGDRGIAQE